MIIKYSDGKVGDVVDSSEHKTELENLTEKATKQDESEIEKIADNKNSQEKVMPFWARKP